jgi:hypothetical protein
MTSSSFLHMPKEETKDQRPNLDDAIEACRNAADYLRDQDFDAGVPGDERAQFVLDALADHLPALYTPVASHLPERGPMNACPACDGGGTIDDCHCQHCRGSGYDPSIPRRIQLLRLTPAEKAIADAVQAVEDVGAHPWLTDAVILLQQARDKVADYVDQIKPAASELPSSERDEGAWEYAIMLQRIIEGICKHGKLPLHAADVAPHHTAMASEYLASLAVPEHRTTTETVYEDIRAERAKQDEQWGGPEHDDMHTSLEWMHYRRKFEVRVGMSHTRERVREQLVKIAALAVAQIQSIDRAAPSPESDV